jgi:glycosyltransferase involved in cell wall biosynthesis
MKGDAELTLAGRVDDTVLAASLVENNANIVGSVGPQRLRDLYRQADVVVLPSRADAFGYVTIEALACGTPVIVSDACGSAEIVSRFDCGWIFTSEDTSGLTDALRRATDPGERLQRAEQALTHRDYFDWKRYGDDLLRLYADIDVAGAHRRDSRA